MHAVLSIGKCYDHRLGLESLCISSDIKIMPVADLVKEVSDCNLHSIFRVIGVGIKMLHQVTVWFWKMYSEELLSEKVIVKTPVSKAI